MSPADDEPPADAAPLPEPDLPPAAEPLHVAVARAALQTVCAAGPAWLVFLGIFLTSSSQPPRESLLYMVPAALCYAGAMALVEQVAWRTADRVYALALCAGFAFVAPLLMFFGVVWVAGLVEGGVDGAVRNLQRGVAELKRAFVRGELELAGVWFGFSFPFALTVGARRWLRERPGLAVWTVLAALIGAAVGVGGMELTNRRIETEVVVWCTGWPLAAGLGLHGGAALFRRWIAPRFEPA